MRKVLAAVIASAMLLSGCSTAQNTDLPDASSPQNSQSSADTTKESATEEVNDDTTAEGYDKFSEKYGFLHVEGDKIVDESGEEIWLKGIACGNNVWVGPSSPVWTSQTEESFNEMADLGFNSSRFYLNYQLFEDDSDPYNYKENGLEWLDENIRWADKYGIGLILNLHVPQGGYQSDGEGTALWTDRENRDRCIALYKEIAKRYSDERAIVGYSLINEPAVPYIGSMDESVDQCRQLMQEITDAIREYDENHLIFAERVNVLQGDISNAEWDSNNAADRWFLLDDENTVYEFHFYTPHDFTHQDFAWAGTEGTTRVYPSDELIVGDARQWRDTTTEYSSEELENGWQLCTTETAARTDEYNIGHVVMQETSLGEDGTAYFDDIVLEEYKDGELVREIKVFDFDTLVPIFSIWSQNDVGSCELSLNGYTGSGLAISGTTDYSVTSICMFLLKDGYEYVVKAKTKTMNAADGSIVCPKIDLYYTEYDNELNAEGLEAELLKDLSFGLENNVPIYLGEFGAGVNCFVDDRGGDRWVSDMLDICKKYNLHFSYHEYHEMDAFGLYNNYTGELPDNRNDILAQVFINKLVE